MAIRDYLPSFLRREQEANASLLDELTPVERQRLDSTEKDPIEYWERASDKTLLSADILKSMGSRTMAQIANGWTESEAREMNAHMDAKATREWERSEPSAESVRKAERMADATDPMHDERRERQADNYKPQENDIVASTQKQDGLSALDGKSRELVAAAANAIQKVDWTYDRSPDPEGRREGFKHMRAAIHSLDAVVTHGDNLRAEYAIDAVDAVKQHTLRTEAASAIWQHHAPKMASETKEYYRPDWFYSEKLHAHSWDMDKIAVMGQEHQSARPALPTIERVADPMQDVRREAQAHRTTQAQRDAARAQATPSVRSDADRASAAAQILNVVAASL